MKLNLRNLAFTLALATSLTASAADSQRIGSVDTSQWRGFNLLEKFTANRNAPFLEDDFRWIAELGFNFVRLPLDYRCYTEPNHWLQFREEVLRQIDQAVQFGNQYNIHVCSARPMCATKTGTATNSTARCSNCSSSTSSIEPTPSEPAS